MQTIPIRLVLLTFTILQGLILYWISFIPIPGWESRYQMIGYACLLCSVFFLAYILFYYWQHSKKRNRLLWAIGYFLISAILVIYWGFISLFFTVSSVEGFMCSVEQVYPVDFPNYNTTIYLINLSCIPDGHSSVYVQASWLPFMKNIGGFYSPFYDPHSQIEQKNEIVKIIGSSGIIYYDLKEQVSCKF